MLLTDLNLNNPLRNAIDDLGYLHATPIQEQSFSVIMSGKDLVGVAQTGTGKTFAYLLPLLRLHKFSKEKHPRVLILVPTRELVKQVTEEIELLSKYMDLRVDGVYGGTNIRTQKKRVHAGLDFLVATPGRLHDIALSGVLRLKFIKKLVIDEVDEMMDLGFRPQLHNIMDMMPEKRQNLMFSATLSPDIEELISTHFNLPKKIEIAPHGTPLDKIDQQIYHVPNFFTKANLLERLFKEDESMTKVLVFISSKKKADRLQAEIADRFEEEFGVLHGNKSQNNRFKTLEAFEKGDFRVLITTDIMARGLDITDVSHVINFDLPFISPNYIHRIGRTGRAEKPGVAISFANQAELELQKNIEDLMKMPIPVKELPEDLEISNVITDEERPRGGDKNYLVNADLKSSKGAFHKKKERPARGVVRSGRSKKRRK